MAYDLKRHCINAFDNLLWAFQDMSILKREDVQFLQKELMKRIKR